MPFRHRRRRTRRTRRKPKALIAVRRLARFVDTELHENQILNDGIGIQSTPAFFQLIFAAQGDDNNERNGIQITCRSLELRFVGEMGNVNANMRVIVLIDKQSNGAAPTAAEVLEDTGTATAQLASMYNTDFKKRFTILSDRCRSFVEGRSDTMCWHMKRRLSHKVRFDGSGSGIGNVVSGMVWAMVYTDQLGGAAAVTVTLASFITFAP